MLEAHFERESDVPRMSFNKNCLSVFWLDLFHRDDLVDGNDDLLGRYLEPIRKEKNLSFGPRWVEPFLEINYLELLSRKEDTWNRQLLNKLLGLKCLEIRFLEADRRCYLRFDSFQSHFEWTSQRQCLFRFLRCYINMRDKKHRKP